MIVCFERKNREETCAVDNHATKQNGPPIANEFATRGRNPFHATCTKRRHTRRSTENSLTKVAARQTLFSKSG